MFQEFEMKIRDFPVRKPIIIDINQRPSLESLILTIIYNKSIISKIRSEIQIYHFLQITNI